MKLNLRNQNETQHCSDGVLGSGVKKKYGNYPPANICSHCGENEFEISQYPRESDPNEFENYADRLELKCKKCGSTTGYYPSDCARLFTNKELNG